MATEARDVEVQEAFREAFEKLESIRDCLMRLRDVIIEESNDVFRKND